MENRIITVSKTASMNVMPNRVVIRLCAEGEGKTSKDATQKVNELSAALKKKLAEMKVPDKTVGTEAIRVSRVARDNKLVGYKAQIDCTIELDYDGDHSGDVWLAQIEDGISGLGISMRTEFEYADCGLRKKLIQTAVENARADAEAIAAAAGVKIKGLYRAEYSSDGGARPMMFRAVAASSFEDGMISPQKITVAETVACAWEIE